MKSNFSFPVLEHPAPNCDNKNALDLAKDWMQLDQNSIVTPLVSERDRNFLISSNQEKAILKISNHKEERGVLEFQTEALLHLQKTTTTILEILLHPGCTPDLAPFPLGKFAIVSIP